MAADRPSARRTGFAVGFAFGCFCDHWHAAIDFQKPSSVGGLVARGGECSKLRTVAKVVGVTYVCVYGMEFWGKAAAAMKGELVSNAGLQPASWVMA